MAVSISIKSSKKNKCSSIFLKHIKSSKEIHVTSAFGGDPEIIIENLSGTEIVLYAGQDSIVGPKKLLKAI